MRNRSVYICENWYRVRSTESNNGMRVRVNAIVCRSNQENLIKINMIFCLAVCLFDCLFCLFSFVLFSVLCLLSFAYLRIYSKFLFVFHEWNDHRIRGMNNMNFCITQITKPEIHIWAKKKISRKHQALSFNRHMQSYQMSEMTNILPCCAG